MKRIVTPALFVAAGITLGIVVFSIPSNEEQKAGLTSASIRLIIFGALNLLIIWPFLASLFREWGSWLSKWVVILPKMEARKNLASFAALSLILVYLTMAVATAYESGVRNYRQDKELEATLAQAETNGFLVTKREKGKIIFLAPKKNHWYWGSGPQVIMEEGTWDFDSELQPRTVYRSRWAGELSRFNAPNQFVTHLKGSKGGRYLEITRYSGEDSPR